MSLTIVNAGWAEAGESADELRETIASLEAQLAALYEEKESGAAAVPPTGTAGDAAGAEVMALYEEKLRAGARAAATMRETLASFEAQLAALYADREAEGDAAARLRDESANLAAQLADFYALQERCGLSFDALIARAEAAESFEAQLDALYAEQETRGAAAALDDDRAALVEALASCEAQLVALYEERSRPSADAETIDGLVAQVRVLLDEKQQLERAVADGAAALARAQQRAREIVATLVEKSLALA